MRVCRDDSFFFFVVFSCCLYHQTKQEHLTMMFSKLDPCSTPAIAAQGYPTYVYTRYVPSKPSG